MELCITEEAGPRSTQSSLRAVPRLYVIATGTTQERKVERVRKMPCIPHNRAK